MRAKHLGNCLVIVFEPGIFRLGGKPERSIGKYTQSRNVILKALHSMFVFVVCQGASRCFRNHMLLSN